MNDLSGASYYILVKDQTTTLGLCLLCMPLGPQILVFDVASFRSPSIFPPWRYHWQKHLDDAQIGSKDD